MTLREWYLLYRKIDKNMRQFVVSHEILNSMSRIKFGSGYGDVKV